LQCKVLVVPCNENLKMPFVYYGSPTSSSKLPILHISSPSPLHLLLLTAPPSLLSIGLNTLFKSPPYQSPPVPPQEQPSPRRQDRKDHLPSSYTSTPHSRQTHGSPLCQLPANRHEITPNCSQAWLRLYISWLGHLIRRPAVAGRLESTLPQEMTRRARWRR
jgi:hypothetical protein